MATIGDILEKLFDERQIIIYNIIKIFDECQKERGK